GVGDSDVPAGELELVVHEPRAAHRLDYPEHGHIVQSLCEPGQTVAVGRHSTDRHALALTIERLPVEPFAAEIQSDVQHAMGLPSSYEDARSFAPREALLHQIPYHAIQTATGGSQWQRFGGSSSHFPGLGEPNLCHR